jgi:hypothetical protein
MLTGARVGHSVSASNREGGKNRHPVPEEDPGRRWQSAAELQQELAAVCPSRRRVYMAGGANDFGVSAGLK